MDPPTRLLPHLSFSCSHVRLCSSRAAVAVMWNGGLSTGGGRAQGADRAQTGAV